MNDLQPAARSELEEIVALYRLVGDLGRENGSSDWDETYPSRELAQEDIECGGLFVFKENGRIVAAFSMSHDGPMDGADLPWSGLKSCALSRLCVAPELQGRGFGARMVRCFAGIALDRGYQSVHLMTPTINLAANRMYRRMGFTEVGLFPFEGIVFVCYESALDALIRLQA